MTVELRADQVRLLRWALSAMDRSISMDLHDRSMSPASRNALRYTQEQITEVKEILSPGATG
jgi:hypothetical protein